MLKLTGLLQQCTVLIRVGSSKAGTGFFIRPNVILTCNHVIEDSLTDEINIDVIWQDNVAVNATLLSYSKELDLALLSVSYDNSPYVSIESGIEIGDKLYVYGYPSETLRAYGNYSKGDSISLEFEGFSRSPLLMKLKNGQVVSGFSGAPLLNQRTGGVCGVMRLTRGESNNIGGRAIQISSALKYFNKMLNKQEYFNHENKQWLSLIENKKETIQKVNTNTTQTIKNEGEVHNQIIINSLGKLTIK